MPFPVHYHYRVVILIFDKQTVGFLSASHPVAGEELGRPDDTVEDKAEAAACEGSCPVGCLCTVEQEACVPGVDFLVASAIL